MLLLFNTYSILEAKQHDLQLTDGGAVEVQLQLELRKCVGDDFPICHADKVSQTDHEGGDVLRLQLHFLRALGMTGCGDGGRSHKNRGSSLHDVVDLAVSDSIHLPV